MGMREGGGKERGGRKEGRKEGDEQTQTDD